MKKIKNIFAVLLCLVMLFSFAACRDKDEDADTTTESTATETEAVETVKPLEEVGLSLDKLEKANELEALTEKYDTVTVKHSYSGAVTHIRQIFEYDGEIACVEKNGDTVDGLIKGFRIVAENNRVKVYRDIEDLENGEEFDGDDVITELFADKELVYAGETDKEYKLKSLSEDKEKNAELYCYFDKESLALTKITFENSVGNSYEVEVTYNGELEDFVKEITDAFDGKMKTVTIVAEMIGDSAVESVTVKLSLPASWEYIPTGDGRIDYYMDEAGTEAYAYPGDSKDYTLYITNVFDEEDGGKK